MATETEIIDNATTTKQNFANSSDDEDPQDLVFKERLRVWQKITRFTDESSNELAIIIPFDTFLEPYFNTEDVDTSNTSAIYDSSNDYYRLYTDINGNYKILQSKDICFQEDRTIKTINFTVIAEDTSGNTTTNYIAEVYNGNEWIPVENGSVVEMRDYSGSDLDADLDADLGARFSNKDSDGNITFQNKLKYRITRVGSEEVRVKKVILKVTWNEGITKPVNGWINSWGVWGTPI